MIRHAVGMTFARAGLLSGRQLSQSAAASAGMRPFSLMVAPAILQSLEKSAVDTPFMDVVKMHTDDAGPVKFTTKQLWRQVNAFAKGLDEAMFTPQTKFVVWTKDIAESLVAQLAAVKAGVPIVVLGKDASEKEVADALVGARALLFSPFLRPQEECMNIVRKLVPELVDAERGDETWLLIRSRAYPELRWVMHTGFERQKGMIKFAHVFNYSPDAYDPEHPLGKVTYAGPGSATEVKELPYFDSTVTFIPDEELFN